MDPSKSNILTFDVDESEPYLSHQLTLQIQVGVLVKNVFHTVVDEGDYTCIVSISCWKSLGSPLLLTSSTILKAFDGHTFYPHQIISTFLKEIGVKNFSVEVVDAPIYYNLLFGKHWFYEMKEVSSS